MFRNRTDIHSTTFINSSQRVLRPKFLKNEDRPISRRFIVINIKTKEKILKLFTQKGRLLNRWRLSKKQTLRINRPEECSRIDLSYFWIFISRIDFLKQSKSKIRVNCDNRHWKIQNIRKRFFVSFWIYLFKNPYRSVGTAPFHYKFTKMIMADLFWILGQVWDQNRSIKGRDIYVIYVRICPKT